MSNPNNWEVRSTHGDGSPDHVVNTDTGQEGRVFTGWSVDVSDVRDNDGNSIGSFETSE